MGLFMKENEHGRKEPRIGRMIGAGVTGLFGAAAIASSVYINEAREASLEVMFGNVTETITEPGLNFKIPFLSSRYAYSLAPQWAEIGAETSLRTSDDTRLTNPFTIQYEIDENADVENLYYQLRGAGQDLELFINRTARDAAVRVFETLDVSDLAEEGFTDLITQGIQDRLQADLIEGGWPIRIVDITSDGFTLSPGSEGSLERIVDIRQERVRLELREENAIVAERVLRQEALAYVAYADELSAAGLPAEDLRCAIHDKMAQDSGRIMQPFAQVCGVTSASVGQDIAVAVDPANVDINPVIQPSMPVPAGQ